MMKDPKSMPARLMKNGQPGNSEDPNSPAYFFGPNAFINVIDIMREQVIAQIRINPGQGKIRHLSSYFKSNSKSYSEKTLTLSHNRHSKYGPKGRK